MLGELYRRILQRGSIDEMELKKTLKELQRALLTADVEVEQVLKLTKRIEERFKGEAKKSINTTKLLGRVIYEELKDLLGREGELPLEPQKVMLVGLYGAGKTTTAAKLARYFSQRGLKSYLASVDFDRPAGREQLRQLAPKAQATYIDGESPREVVERAEEAYRKGGVVVLDTPGRNALDEDLLRELREVWEAFQPHRVVLVVAADTGSAVKKHAKALSEAVPLDGVIITKFEGSGRAGGALSAAAEVGIPIYFLGTGEKLEELEPFKQEWVVKKLLGLPTLEKVAEEVGRAKAESLGEFSLLAFQEQMKALKGSSLSSLISSLGISVPEEMLLKGEVEMKKMDAIINSMTPEERANPELVVKSPSRIRRIARGSGTAEGDVKKLLKQFFKAKKLFKKMKRNRGMLGRLLTGG